MPHYLDHEVCVDRLGYERGDVDLRWHDGRLQVAAERRVGGEQTRVLILPAVSLERLSPSRGSEHLQEVTADSISRHVPVARKVGRGAISPAFDDGALQPTLPVAEEGRPGARANDRRGRAPPGAT